MNAITSPADKACFQAFRAELHTLHNCITGMQFLADLIASTVSANAYAMHWLVAMSTEFFSDRKTRLLAHLACVQPENTALARELAAILEEASLSLDAAVAMAYYFFEHVDDEPLDIDAEHFVRVIVAMVNEFDKACTEAIELLQRQGIAYIAIQRVTHATSPR